MGATEALDQVKTLNQETSGYRYRVCKEFSGGGYAIGNILNYIY